MPHFLNQNAHDYNNIINAPIPDPLHDKNSIMHYTKPPEVDRTWPFSAYGPPPNAARAIFVNGKA